MIRKKVYHAPDTDVLSAWPVEGLMVGSALTMDLDDGVMDTGDYDWGLDN